ncbi:MAG TPA: hypothetical protein VF538_19145 [Pyrinomonadaceae bacterium]|jgi:hypothetical protein
MSTTALIVEMVIVGFQALIWMSLIVLIVFGHDWIDISKLKDWATLISLGLIAISYTIGIIFNSLIGSTFFRWESKNWRLFTHLPERPARMRAYILIKSKDASENLEKRFYQNRLLRGTSINVLFIGAAVLILALKHSGFSWRVLIGISFSTIFVTGIILLSWMQTLQGYYFYLTEVYKAIKKVDELTS